MRVSKDSFLEHVKWLRRAVMASRAELLLAGDSMQALVRQGPRHWVLHPQFLTETAGGMALTPQLHDETAAFLGWLPYRRGQPLGPDRMSFIRLARSLGLPTPDVSSEAGREAGREATPAPRIEGERLRLWFWNGSPACAEQVAARSAADGGASSAKAPRPLNPFSSPPPEWMAVIRRAGRELLAALPEASRAAALFTVDVVVDRENRAWFVDMNADPFVHPFVYPVMVESLLALESGASPTAAPPANTTTGGGDAARASRSPER
jgi:hypothetical protein